MNAVMRASKDGKPRRANLRKDDMPSVPSVLSSLPSQRCIRNEKPSSLPAGYIPTSLDICCGRGKKNWNRGGNANYRETIRSNVSRYIEAPTKKDKSKVVSSIVDELRGKACKFLKEDDVGMWWYDIGDAQAREKVGHSLRDHVTNLSRQRRRESRRKANRSKPPHRHSIAHSDSAGQIEDRRTSLVSSSVVDSFAKRPSLVASTTGCIDHRTQHPTREPEGERAHPPNSDLADVLNSFPEQCGHDEGSAGFAPLDEAELLQEDILEECFENQGNV